MSYIAALTEGSDDIFGTKTLNLAVSSFSPCVFKSGVVLSVVANGKGRVYFERQILTLLVVHPNLNLSDIKFSLFSFLVKQSQGFGHEAFDVATEPALNLDRKQRELPLATM